MGEQPRDFGAGVFDHAGMRDGEADVRGRVVDDPGPEVARLLAHLDLDPDPASVSATGKVFVPEMGTNKVSKDAVPDQVRRGFSRREAWHQIDMSEFEEAQREVLVAMWARFGEALEF